MMKSNGNNSKLKKVIFLCRINEPYQIDDTYQSKTGPHNDLEKPNHSGTGLTMNKYYESVNEALSNLIDTNPDIRICFSISGPSLTQFDRYAPEVLESFRGLQQTGCVEFISETSYHSLACMISVDEFKAQALEHRDMMHRYLEVETDVFMNTGLIYQDDIGLWLSQMDFKGVLANGNYEEGEGEVYQHPNENSFSVFVQHASLTTALSRLINYNLSLDEYLETVHRAEGEIAVIGLQLQPATNHDHTTEPWMKLLYDMAAHKGILMSTFSDIINARESNVGQPRMFRSWSSELDGLSQWLGNEMQQKAFDELNSLKESVDKLNDPFITSQWRYLQMSDHFRYMITELAPYEKYQTPYTSPYEAFSNYMNMLNDFTNRLQSTYHVEDADDHVKSIESDRHHIQTPLWAIKKESHHKHVSESRI